MSSSLDQLRRCSIAVDFGTVRTRVYVKQSGVVVDEPSAAAVDKRSGALIAVGVPAERMEGRSPDYIHIARPISGGTIVDIDMARRMLRALIGQKASRAWRRRSRLRAAVCVPHDADPLAQRAAVETLAGLGARRVELVDTPLSAAVGSGLPVEKPEARMIAVCGATTTQIAVVCMGAVVAAEKAPVGGESIDRAVLQHLRQRHGVLLRGDHGRPLHEILDLGDGDPAAEGVEVAGRDVATGCPRTVLIRPEAVWEALQVPLTGLLDAVREVLHRCPPDLVADLVDPGLTLAGGSARLPQLDTMLAQALGVPVQVAEDPEGCVVRGLGAMLEGRTRLAHFSPLRV